ncbi:MAG: DUF721 domain-containing protein [Gemmatimonadetes bacterium]|nr:DUF721 domain-containing protein [Gemmatimonadota bacterium]MYA10707.1 DUF721 domain-containing protein [Gemmatimonadota bacterium]MYD13344.1 DUF721 domain-containing protein [Gemmatimonadota bacterium]MYE70254.1 DUF721 domain-containing protein [Gemmatimonadota bacterium]MYI66815.1 DUF721 domain-containing protein [Gemmatimonadota bacterium]
MLAHPRRGDRGVRAAGAARGAVGRPEPVGEILAGYLDRTGLGEALGRLGALDEWTCAVGPRVSRVTRPVEVRGDTLVVEVVSSAWLAELSMMRPLILEQVNKARAGPAIGDVRFRLAEQ